MTETEADGQIWQTSMPSSVLATDLWRVGNVSARITKRVVLRPERAEVGASFPMTPPPGRRARQDKGDLDSNLLAGIDDTERGPATSRTRRPGSS